MKFYQIVVAFLVFCLLDTHQQENENLKKLLDVVGKKLHTESSNIISTNDTSLFKHARNYLLEHFEPANIPNILKTYGKKYFGLGLLMKIELVNGTLHGLSEVQQRDYSTITTKGDKLTVSTPLIVEELKFHYWYNVKIRNHGLTGTLNGIVTNAKIDFEVVFDTNELKIDYVHFSNANCDDINLQFHGHSALDKMFGLFNNIIFHNTLKTKILTETGIFLKNALYRSLNLIVDSIKEYWVSVRKQIESLDQLAILNLPKLIDIVLQFAE